MEDDDIENGRVVLLSGSYPNLSFEDPTKRSRRPRVRSKKGAAAEMDKAIQDEKRVYAQWRQGLADFIELEAKSGGQLDGASQVKAETLIRKVQELSELHDQACVRIQHSQAPSDDIDEQLEACKTRREKLKAQMDQMRAFRQRLQLLQAAKESADDPGEVTDGAPTMGPPPARTTSSKKSTSSKPSTSRSRRSAAERVRSQLKVQEIEARHKLQEEAAAQEAAVAALKRKEELVAAQFALKTAEALEALENEQELGSDDPDRDQTEACPRPSTLHSHAKSFEPRLQAPVLPDVPHGYAAARGAMPVWTANHLVGPPEIKVFDGEPGEWVGFVLAFEEVYVKNIESNALKLQKLLQYCGPKVKPRIVIFQHDTVNGFDRAIRLLWELFGHPALLVKQVVDGLTLGLPQIRPKDREGLLLFSHQLSCALETVRAIQVVHVKELMYNYMPCLDNWTVLEKLLKRLPVFLANEFVSSLGTSPGSVTELSEFLHKKTAASAHPLLLSLSQEQKNEIPKLVNVRAQAKRRTVFMTEDREESGDESPNDGGATYVTTTKAIELCQCCKRKHELSKCDQFNKLTAFNRRAVLMKSRLCFNCFQPNHVQSECHKQSRCKKRGCTWKGKHDYRIHRDPVENEETKAREGTEDARSAPVNDERKRSGPIGSNLAEKSDSFCTMADNRLFMGTIGIRLVNPESGQSISCFAMMDTCSTMDLVTEEAVRLLGLSTKLEKKETTIHTVNGTVKAKRKATAVIVGHVHDSDVRQHLNGVKIVKQGCFDNSRCLTPGDKDRWPQFASVVASDEVDVPRVLALISIRHGQLQRPEEVIPVREDMYTVKTRLGHVVYGGTKDKDTSSDVFFVDQISDKLNTLLEVDQIGSGQMYDTKRMPSWDERVAAKKIEDSIRVVDGVYEVAVPWKEKDVRMIDNHSEAYGRAEVMRKGFKKNPEKFKEYNEVIQAYLRDGHAERVPDQELVAEPGKKHYLFHHGVKHPRKKSLRVVFNASRKSGGISVNDQVMKCPDKLEKLVGILMRFREFPVAISADIVAFFHNIRIPKQDQDFGRFFWFEEGNVSDPLVEFRLLKHLFGGVASQACSVLALNHCIKKQVPERWTEQFSENVIRGFYSDDLLRSFETATEATSVCQEVKSVLKESGFELSKFRSNDEEVQAVLSQTEEQRLRDEVQIGEPDKYEESALGVVWQLKQDVLLFRGPRKAAEVPKTKRGTLAFLMGVYDPLGTVIPFVLPLKLFLQNLVIEKYDWDETLRPDHELELQKCLENIERLGELQVQRCYVTSRLGRVKNRSLHVFADGSTKSYGCCVYLRSQDEEGNVECQLVMAKSKVCPAKRSLTIPRVELTAAVLATRLSNFVKKELSVPIDEVKFWVDSVSTLRYIQSRCRRFQVYVANRVSEIQECTDIAAWSYLNTALNPADMASRPVVVPDVPMEDSRVRMWFTGPKFLRLPESEWPRETGMTCEVEPDDPELKADIFVTHDNEVEPVLNRLIVKSPTLYIMKIRVAWLQLFCRYLQDKSKDLKPPGCQDLSVAEEGIVRFVQREAFGEQIEKIKNGKVLEKHSPLKKLSPFVDGSGTLRVGSRLSGDELPYQFRFPAILPRGHHFTELCVWEAHKALGHQGLNAVLSHLRRKYWIVGGRAVVRSLLHSCLECKRYHARLGSQLMAELPQERLALEEPFFTNSAVDLFGPFETKRGRSMVKRYVALFCCMTSRAVHLELVSSLEMDSFLDAFRRFQCRRGEIRRLTSDNATNFTSSNRELRAVFEEWNDKLEERFRQMSVDWRFLPSRASHHGGVHERLIRSARSCLRHVLSKQPLTDESMTTLVVECEYILNSRPLTPMSDDPSDLRPLTPNDVLIPRPGTGLPPGYHPPGEALRKRWRTVQQLTCQFWKRFRSEYLNLLSLRTKWLTERRSFVVGDLVLVAESNLPRSQWCLGRVLEVFVGRDGRVRSCRVKTKASVSLIRPIVKLCLLEAASVA